MKNLQGFQNNLREAQMKLETVKQQLLSSGKAWTPEQKAQLTALQQAVAFLTNAVNDLGVSDR